MRRLGKAAFVLAIALAGWPGCTDEVGHPPVARIRVAPTYVFAGDNFLTPVTLDASASADEVDDPGATRPLQYRWELPADEVRIQQGGLDQPVLTVLLRGDRPVAVALVVTDGDDRLSTRATATVGLTIP